MKGRVAEPQYNVNDGSVTSNGKIGTRATDKFGEGGHL